MKSFSLGNASESTPNLTNEPKQRSEFRKSVHGSLILLRAADRNQQLKKKMKRLNIFVPSNKRKSDRGPDSPQPQSKESGDTLNRIVNQKEEEKRRFELEQAQFDRRRREYEVNLVEIERREVERREQEVRKWSEDLDDIKRKNKLVQDTVVEQTKTLERKLEELKLEHKAKEESRENEIEQMEDKLLEVKQGLEKRMKDMNISMEKEEDVKVGDDAENLPVPSAPRASPLREENGVYPPIPVMTRSYESTKVMQVAPHIVPRQFLPGSVTSSPLSSHGASSDSSV